MSKISCNIDAFRHSDKPHEYAYKILSDLEFDAVEPEVLDGRCIYTTYHYCPMVSLMDDPIEIKKTISRYGLEVSCISAHTSLLNTEYGVQYLNRAIRFADQIGTRIVNTSEGPRPRGLSDNDAYKMMQYNLKEVLDTAESHNMLLTIEPHGEFTTHAEGLLKILSLVESDNLAINFDTGNVFLAGNDPIRELEAVADRVRYVHVKDIGGALIDERGKVTGTPVGVAIGKGNVDIKKCIDILEKAGYDGYYSIEAGEKDLQESISHLRSIT